MYDETVIGATNNMFWFNTNALGNELMTTYFPAGEGKLLTDFTIALVEDTGWYYWDRTKPYANLLHGSKKGCDFTYSKTCSEFYNNYNDYCKIPASG